MIPESRTNMNDQGSLLVALVHESSSYSFPSTHYWVLVGGYHGSVMKPAGPDTANQIIFSFFMS